jgi:hypothetical protein
MLFSAGAATAADSQAIYNDVADGHLSRSYSQADLQAATKDASVEGYGGVTEQTMRPVVQQVASQTKTLRCAGLNRKGNKIMAPATGAQSGSSHACVRGAQFTKTAPAGTLPFTGLQLGVFAALGLALLAGGLLLRRASRD